MSESAHRMVPPAAKSLSQAQGVLQRKCDCGNHTVAGRVCEDCAKQHNALQNTVNGRRVTGAGLSSSAVPLIQANLTIGAIDDSLEAEADRVAEQVIAVPAHTRVKGRPPRIQRVSGQSTRQVDTVAPNVERVLAGSGRLLDPTLQQDMGQRFGHDFSSVRVHSGALAEQSAREVNANAYTVGRDIVFGAGRFAPGSYEGRQLLAHELTHVVQSDLAASNPALPSSPIETLEREARQVAGAVCSSDAMSPVRGAARNLAIPLRQGPDDPGTATFGNLPLEAPDPEGMRRRVVLVEEDGRWYEIRPDGKKWRARGSYDFVVQNGKIWAVKGTSRMGGLNPGHTEAAAGGRVEYAGIVRFGSGESARGSVQEWSNASGHYAAVRYFAKNAGLPMDKFKPVEKGFPDRGPQLPVFQPGKGASFAPGADVESTGQLPTQGPIPPPPDWITARSPLSPTLPPSAVTTDDPRTVGKLYSPNLAQEYRNQHALYNFSRAALDDLEATELTAGLSEQEKQAKATLTAQVTAAQARMLQARKDYEMLDSPTATPQQLQEMFARRGIAIPVVPQTEQSGAAGLKGSGISGWRLDDKGLTRQSSTATTRTIIGPDDKPITITDEDSSSTNIGVGTAKRVSGATVTSVKGDTSTTVGRTQTTGVDLLKGEAGISKDVTKQVTGDTGTTTKITDRTSYTAGVGGIARTKEDSTQVGGRIDSKSSNLGVSRGPGQLGVTAGGTRKSGTMVGLPGEEKLDQGTEKSQKVSGGLVSDDKGTGIGGIASQERKTSLGEGRSISTTVAAGGRCQALVKEIPGSEPPKFTISTTISFDLKLGTSVAKNLEAKPGAQQDKGLKANVSGGAGASLGMYASFKRELTEAEAGKYLEFIKQHGRGSALPEHRILATGATQGWESAKRLWQAMNGSPETLRSMKPGEEVETNVEVGGEAKLGVAGGQSSQGGLSLGGEATATGKHKINVRKAAMPDGKILVTAAIDDEGEIAGSLTASMGIVGMKAGKSYTEGRGRTVVFILDPNDPSCGSQLAAIEHAATPEDLDRITAKRLSKTDKQVEGEGSSPGVNVGPVSIDFVGKGTLTSEVTRDEAGKVIGSKYTGENQGGGTIGVGGVKVGDSKTETYVGEVDKSGQATGELSETKKSTSLSKTVLSAGGKLTQDPLGTLMSPGKLIEEESEKKGTAIADPQIMTMCYAALDRAKWNGRVGGYRQEDWIKTGNKIRNACVVRGTGREAEIVSVDKNAVQQALAKWTKADADGRKEALDSIIRPLGGIPEGKAFAFPDGTEGMKAEWDALIIKDPLETARTKLADKKTQEALAEMQTVRGRVAHLYASVNSASYKWGGLEIQHAEMLGHINTRINEVNKAIRELSGTGAAAPKPGAPVVTPALTTGEVKEQENRARADDARADLETYNNNIATMKGYADSVFKKLAQVEAKIKDEGLFSGSKMSRIIEANPMVKEAEDLIKIWDALYWQTFELYKKLSPFMALDKSRLEKLHTAGARARWHTVYDLTRDTSMAGRAL